MIVKLLSLSSASVLFILLCCGSHAHIGIVSAASSTTAPLENNKTTYRYENQTRLQCLQKGFGGATSVEQQTGHWTRGHMDANAKKTDEMQWVYDDTGCSFAPFDHKHFCQK